MMHVCLLRKRKKRENVCLKVLAEIKTGGKCFEASDPWE